MIEGHNIVCFPPNRWDDLWRNRQQIMSRLAEHNRILYVHAPHDVRQLRAYVRQPARWLAGPRLTSPLPNLWLYEHPLYGARSGREPLKSLTFRLRLRSLRRSLRRLHMADPILWLFSYEWAEYLGRLGEKLAIYHAVDEYSAYEAEYVDIVGQERRRLIQRLEAETIRRVDLVFVTSPALLASKSPLHPHVTLVENGVDYEHFSSPGSLVPHEVEGLAHPRIGFAGAINEKLDLSLLRALALRQPAWQFLMIGPTALRYDRQQLATVQALPNVHFLGHKAVADLPAYLHACDACIIPYKRNEWTRNISPLKLYEYLATGLPIVSTDIPAARQFAGLIWLATDAAAFADAIAAALAADSSARRQRQQAIARRHTWSKRVETLSAAIEQRLAAKAS